MKPQAIKYQQCELLAGATHKFIHYNLSNINKSGKKYLVAPKRKHTAAQLALKREQFHCRQLCNNINQNIIG